ncbi:MAG: glutathione S-transferase family protein [Candidatus Omnitrophica bacterium]|nr:glutathione S-transferase family protein [Candidatus Omnitrophota bacterium]
MMKLLYTTRSPYARKVRIFALEKNIDLDLVPEDLTAKSETLLKNNPSGKVPTLILENGQALADSAVICEYLEYLKPEPRLIPTDPEKRFQILHMDAVAKGMTDVTVSVFYERFLHKDNAHKPFLESRKKIIHDCLSFFENRLPHLEELHAASINLACGIGYLEFRFADFGFRQQFPAIMTWYDKFIQRPSLKKTIPVE